MNSFRLRFAALLLVFPLLLVACAPGASSLLNPPGFRLLSATVERLEPAGVGMGMARVHLELEAINPNPFPVNLAGLDGDFYLSGNRVGETSFSEPIALPASGSSRLGLDVDLPVAGGPALLDSLARLVTGGAVAFRADATLRVDLLGTVQTFPAITVASGQLSLPDGLRPPRLRVDLEGTRVFRNGLSARVEVPLEIENPVPIGYYLRAPEVELTVDGHRAGSARLASMPVTANGSTRTVLAFDLNLAGAGAGLLARLQGAGAGLSFELEGELALELPGIHSQRTTLAAVTGEWR